MPTKCGCLYCKRIPIPTTREGWKSRRNKVNHIYGTNGKPTKQTRKIQAH